MKFINSEKTVETACRVKGRLRGARHRGRAWPPDGGTPSLHPPRATPDGGTPSLHLTPRATPLGDGDDMNHVHPCLHGHMRMLFYEQHHQWTAIRSSRNKNTPTWRNKSILSRETTSCRNCLKSKQFAQSSRHRSPIAASYR